MWAMGATTITNSTLSENQGYANGGGLFIPFQSGTLAMSHSTISGNILNFAGDKGGGIFLSDPLPSTQHTITNSIVAGNYKYPAGRDDVTGPFAAAFTMIGTNVNATITDNGGNLIGTPAADRSAAWSVGRQRRPTLTHRLLPGSPALDAGNPAIASPPNFDQRGPGYAHIGWSDRHWCF